MERENGKAIKTQSTITYTMAIILMIKNKEWVFSHGQAEIFTKVIIKMMSVMGMDRCYGQMEAYTKENGKMEFSMV